MNTQPITATYHPPPDRKPYRITNLRLPGWWAFAHSFVCGTDPQGMVRVLDRAGVQVTVGEKTVKLDEYLAAGGKLEEIA